MSMTPQDMALVKGLITSAINKSDLLKNVVLNVKATAPSYTVTTPNAAITAAPTYSFTVPNLNDLVLLTLGIGYDSNTQSNFEIRIVIDGTPISTDFMSFPSGTSWNIFDNNKIDIMPQSTIKIYTYMSGTATTNGVLDVTLLAGVLK